MRRSKFPAPTKWDEKLVEYLRPLAKADWVHRTLFFANTFPLGFHYAWALEMEGKNPETYLLSSAWEPTTPYLQRKDEKAFFWTTQSRVPDNHASAFIPVTEFQPKYVFIQKTLATSRIFDEFKIQKDKELSLMDFLKSAKPHYDKFEIYAELDVLGDYLKIKVSPEIRESRVYDAASSKGWPLIEPFLDRGHSTLRLFIYGGPLSTYLKRKINHYIRTVINVNASDVAERRLATGIQMIGSLNASCKHAIQTYHRELYLAVDQMRSGQGKYVSECPPFYSVCRAYNDTAWLLQHRSSFKEPFEYADCIREHHREMTT